MYIAPQEQEILETRFEHKRLNLFLNEVRICDILERVFDFVFSRSLRISLTVGLKISTNLV